MPPEPEMLLPRISTPKPELGSQAPRCVVICTLQLPSNDVRARAVPVAAAAAIATAATAQTVGSDIKFIAAKPFPVEDDPDLKGAWCWRRDRALWGRALHFGEEPYTLSSKPRELLAWYCRHLLALAATIEGRLDRRGDTSQ
jgi:hypothetical protein